MSEDRIQPVLSIRNLTVDLPEGGDRAHAVQNLSFDIMPKETVCVVGESGSGKSITSFTAMGLLPKALKVSTGEILVSGRNVVGLAEAEHRKMRGGKMAMIFQEPMTALNPCYTVGDQIEEVFLAHTSMTRAERRQRTMDLLAEVHMPDPKRIYHSFPHQLSGGQRQRIVIAIALAMNPSLLIADEPTTALDVTTQAQILDLMKELKAKREAGILFVTHDFDVVAEIADRVVVMQAGRVVEQGTADEVLNHPKHAYTRQLIAAVPRRGEARPVVERSGEAALELAGLEKTYHIPRTMFSDARTINAVQPLDLTVYRGETLGVVGESGSGKSTLVKCLMRLVEPTAGAIRIDGVDMAASTRRDIRLARKDMQIVFQDPYGSLNPRRTIGDQLIQGPLNFGARRSEATARAKELLRIVRLGEDAFHRYPSQFSGGQRQRICIARALMLEPKVLIADEAVSALDVSVQKEVLQLLQDIKTRMNLTMIFITHDLRVAAEVSDRLIVMQKGEIVEQGTVEQVFGSPRHAYTRQLFEAMPGGNWQVPDLDALPPATH